MKIIRLINEEYCILVMSLSKINMAKSRELIIFAKIIHIEDKLMIKKNP